MPRESGDGENTVSFMKRLRKLNPEKKLMIIWDGARYHDCGEVRAYLDEVNRGLEAVSYTHLTLPTNREV